MLIQLYSGAKIISSVDFMQNYYCTFLNCNQGGGSTQILAPGTFVSSYIAAEMTLHYVRPVGQLLVIGGEIAHRGSYVKKCADIHRYCCS